VRKGQPPNCAHQHESHPGELTDYVKYAKGGARFEIICDKFTDKTPEDYNILFIAQKQ
jgi:hypothetical protein